MAAECCSSYGRLAIPALAGLLVLTVMNYAPPATVIVLGEPHSTLNLLTVCEITLPPAILTA